MHAGTGESSCSSRGLIEIASFQKSPVRENKYIRFKAWTESHDVNIYTTLVVLVLPLPARHLRRGSGRWDLGPVQQRPGTQHTLIYYNL